MTCPCGATFEWESPYAGDSAFARDAWLKAHRGELHQVKA